MANAQFVIAGRADCERYARLEAAAEQLQALLPSCCVYKEPQSADHWPCYLRRVCLQQGWHLPADPEAPLVWRPLVHRGGRAMLIGGLSEFLQLAAVWYGIPLTTLDAVSAAAAAEATARQHQHEQAQRRHQRAMLDRQLTVVALVGAPSQVAEHLSVAVATGRVLGPETLLRLQIHGDPRLPELTQLRYELQDLASEQLCQVVLLPSITEAVRNAAVVIVLDPILNEHPPERRKTISATDTGSRTLTSKATLPVITSDPEIAAVIKASQTASSEADDTIPPESTPSPQQVDTVQSPVSLAQEPSAESPPPSRPRLTSSETRRLSTIQEEPDSEAHEEEEMAALVASRPTSGRSGISSQEPIIDTPRSWTPADSNVTGTEEGTPEPDVNRRDATSKTTGPVSLSEAIAAVTADKPGNEPQKQNLPGTGSGESVTESVQPGSAPVSANKEEGAGDGSPLDTGKFEAPVDLLQGLKLCPVPEEEVNTLFSRMRDCGEAIERTAGRHCRVVVAGGRLPCFAATVLLLHAPRIPVTHVIAVTEPRGNQLRTLLARQLGVRATDIHNLVEWGCPPAGHHWLDVESASISHHDGAIRGPPGYTRPILDVLFDKQWLAHELSQELAERAGIVRLHEGAEVSALSLASCLADILRRWWTARDDDEERSLGVATNGCMSGVPERLVLAAPVRLSAGNFHTVRTVPGDATGAAYMRAAATQTLEWLHGCGVTVSPSGQLISISPRASSIFSRQPSVNSEQDPAGDGEAASAEVSETGTELEKRPSAARGERTHSTASLDMTQELDDTDQTATARATVEGSDGADETKMAAENEAPAEDADSAATTPAPDGADTADSGGGETATPVDDDIEAIPYSETAYPAEEENDTKPDSETVSPTNGGIEAQPDPETA